MSSRLIGCALVAAMALGAALPAAAQDRQRSRGRPSAQVRDRGWRDRDIHRFRDHDFARWRGGRWFHGNHGGRPGWWWIVGGTWYYYPAPVYPYPSPYVPPYAAPGAPAWYFCQPLNAYYPYAPTCPAPWQIVPQS